MTPWPTPPAPSAIAAARHAAGLTQAQAGALVYSPARTWQDWERGRRTMHPAMWEAWQAKVAEKHITSNPG